MWSLAYDIPINFATTDFSPDYDHSIVTSVDTSADGMSFTYHFRTGVRVVRRRAVQRGGRRVDD